MAIKTRRPAGLTKPLKTITEIWRGSGLILNIHERLQTSRETYRVYYTILMVTLLPAQGLYRSRTYGPPPSMF